MPLPNTYLWHLVEGNDPGDIDDWIGRWHAGASTMPLHEFLGFTREEYAHWLVAPDVVPHMVAIHRLSGPARDALVVAVRRDTVGLD